MQICNEGLKLMLRDSSTRELEEYRHKVSSVGANFSEEQDMQGATFAYVLYKMTEHTQVEELHNLQVTSMMHVEHLALACSNNGHDCITSTLIWAHVPM